MKKHIRTVLFILLLTGSFLCGAWYNGGGGGKDKQGERKVLYYVDPMNPSHTSDKPGIAPCGMALEPVYGEDDAYGSGNRARLMPPGTARITPERQQMFGIRVEEVEVSPLTHALRALGRVSPDENRTFRMLAGADGWVWNVQEATTGSLVKKDQLMATVYNYQFLAREQQYLFAIDFAERNKQLQAQPLPPPKPGERRITGNFASGNTAQMVPTAPSGLNPTGNVYYVEDQVALAKLELYNLGVGEYQVRDLARTKRVTTELEVRSPVNGIVLARNVSPMQRFDKGAELYQIADLGRVWVLADVFENEAGYVQPGMKARVTLPDDGRVFDAEVTDVPPRFDLTTRSLKVRLEAENSHFELRPDMFVDVEMLIDFPPVINVPVDAVLDSGLTKKVFVDQGDGYLEPRTVKTGWRFGDRVEIVEGVMPGEKIVVSGNFLVDSESRMKLAAAGLFGIPHRDPICGMEIYGSKAEAAGLMAERDGKKAYFCSKECKKAFLDNPAIKADNPSALDSEHASHTAGSMRSMIAASKDPVCGMMVHEKKAEADGLSAEHQGRKFYFCSRECKSHFQMYPDRYAERAARMAGRGKGVKPFEGGASVDPASMKMDTGHDAPDIPLPPKTSMENDAECDAPGHKPILPEVRNHEDKVKDVALSEHRHMGVSHPPRMTPLNLEIQTYSPDQLMKDNQRLMMENGQSMHQNNPGAGDNSPGADDNVPVTANNDRTAQDDGQVTKDDMYYYENYDEAIDGEGGEDD